MLNLKVQMGPLQCEIQSDSEALFSSLLTGMKHLQAPPNSQPCDRVVLVHHKNEPGHPPAPLFEIIRSKDSTFYEVNVFADFDQRDNEAHWKGSMPRGFLHAFQPLIEHWLLAFNGLCFHAATISNGEQSILCLGRSGAGKSTLSNLANAAFADDGSLVFRNTDGWHAAASPFWSDSKAQAVKHDNNLVACIFLHHAQTNQLKKIQQREALAGLLRNMMDLDRSAEDVRSIFSLANQLASEVPMYDYFFVPDPSAVEHLWSQLL